MRSVGGGVVGDGDGKEVVDADAELELWRERPCNLAACLEANIEADPVESLVAGRRGCTGAVSISLSSKSKLEELSLSSPEALPRGSSKDRAVGRLCITIGESNIRLGVW